MSEVQTQKKSESKHTTQNRKWFLVDAKGQILGRLSTRIAIMLMGKNKLDWLPYLDKGDYVLVINAKEIEVTGAKEKNKNYYRYSGYPGGLRVENLKNLRQRKPEDIIYHAVKGMLPKTRLGRAMIKKLFVYAGSSHNHEAQKPEKYDV